MLRRLLGTGILAVLLGCSPPPAGQGRSEEAAPWRVLVASPSASPSSSPSASPSADPRAEEGRFFAYSDWGEACGNLFLWDFAQQEAFVLTGALAGLVWPAFETLRPRVAAKGEKILFNLGDRAFYWDVKKQERTTPVTDGRPLVLGGPQAVVTPDGKWLAYISARETLVVKTLEGLYIAKVVEFADVAAEGPVWDVDMTGDATRFVLNIAGRAYFYDRWVRRLYLMLPLDGRALAGEYGPLGEVAIAPSGGACALAWADGRVTLIGPTGRLVETLPTLGLVDGRVVDLYFPTDDVLIIEVVTHGISHVFAYDRFTGLLRALVLANDVLDDCLK